MTQRPVGYYVHHHGAGHWMRAKLIAPRLDRPCTIIGTLAGIDDDAAGFDRLDLPDDRMNGVEGADGERSRPACLHYAPLGSVAIRQRMARIAAWVEANDPVMMIVDVSVEVALMTRLLSVPSIVVRLAGDRTDLPHLEAFRGAEKLLAPFPPELEHARTPAWVIEKSVYGGFLAERTKTAKTAPMRGTRPRIVVLSGRGGDGPPGEALARAARALPGYDWDVLGPVRRAPEKPPSNLRLRGWVADTGAYLAGAAFVIGTGGDGIIADAAVHGSRFVCIPEARPFDEQRTKSVVLHRLGAALHRDGWDRSIDWPALAEDVQALDPKKLAAMAPCDVYGIATALNAISAKFERQQGLSALAKVRTGYPEEA